MKKFILGTLCSLFFFTFFNVSTLKVNAANKSISLPIPQPSVDDISSYFISDGILYNLIAYSTSNASSSYEHVAREIRVTTSSITITLHNPNSFYYIYSFDGSRFLYQGSGNGANGFVLNKTTSNFTQCGFDYVQTSSSISMYDKITWSDTVDVDYTTLLNGIRSDLTKIYNDLNSQLNNLNLSNTSIAQYAFSIQNTTNNIYEYLHLINENIYSQRDYDLNFGTSRASSLQNDIHNITVTDGTLSAYLYPYKQTDANMKYYYCLNIVTTGNRFTYGDSRKLTCQAYASDGENKIPLNTSVGNVSGGGQSVLIFCELEKNNNMPYPIFIQFDLVDVVNGSFNLVNSNFYCLKDGNALTSQEQSFINDNQSTVNSFNTVSGSLDSIESNASQNLNDSLNLLDTNIDILGNSDFLATSNFVRSEMVNLFNIQPLRYIVMYTLILGFAFTIIGIKMR